VKVVRGDDMPADEFRALLDRQPPLEARWQQPAGFGRDWPTPEWHELSEAQHAQMFEVERARARRAEGKVRAIEALVQHGSPFLLDHWCPGSRNGEQRRWKARLREILGLGS
jgi:hypothetical protein